jgi:alanine racemase
MMTGMNPDQAFDGPKEGKLDLTDQFRLTGCVPRPAWIEVEMGRLRWNLRRIQEWRGGGLRMWAVVKDNAYGHGMLPVARAALESGALGLAVNTLGEAAELRAAGIAAPVLLLGERDPEELPFCLEYGVLVSVGDVGLARRLDGLARRAGWCVPVHLKIDTGMSRFGIRWDAVGAVVAELRGLVGLVVEGVMSHFAMSDEADKSFAREQIRRFDAALALVRGWRGAGVQAHLCNSGGFLDLPEARYDAVRLGILPLGVYPSAVCARVDGVRPVLSVKARLVTVREMRPGETYGYGMRYRAGSCRRIGVLPIGYGDGYPRLVNQGEVLVRGRRVPIVGSVAMDAMGIDVSAVPGVEAGEEVVLLGEQGGGVIVANELARWGGTVAYDVLTRWRARLPRVYRGEGGGE